ncbi:MAG: TIGR00159 family protein [Hungatella sp.]|jgi:diadenylate cyclase|nr:TIGR00159 family protein [Hungatella sp.]MCI9501979.1 TIGR00159 family protein [Hungatella sp.]MCI9637781.1 TIGR00159 family protein [Hungatella sp.]
MEDILAMLHGWMSFLPKITYMNIVEIIIIAFLIYEILLWIKNTRAWTLLKGIVFILAFAIFTYILRLDTIMWILQKTALVATTALVIIFQPELRKALEQLGSKNLVSVFLSFDDNKGDQGFTEKTVSELVRASFEMAKVKTGALMVIERGTPLKDIQRTGIDVDGLVTSQLLINIFEHNTPLHDGAVVIRGNRVAAATCYLPLSDNDSINKALGTRHRAAVGISEVTDSLTIVVSEETGRVSVAEHGELQKVKDAETLGRILRESFVQEESGNRFRIWKGRLKDERKTDK